MSIDGQPGCARMQAISRASGDSVGVHPNPELMIVPRVDSPIVARLVPANGLGEFPAGTTVHIAMQVDVQASHEPERAVLRPLDISGQQFLDVAALTPDGDAITVAAMRTKVDQPLGELAHQARVQARALLGVDRVPEQFQINTVVGIDTSASMRASASDGGVEAVLDVLAGLSTVVGSDRGLQVCLLSREVVWVPETQASEIAHRSIELLDTRPITSGFRSAVTELSGLYPNDNTVTYLITDGIPADIEALTAADEIDGEARHLVSLVPTTVSQLRRFRALVPVTAVAPPREGVSASVQLLQEPGALTSVVRSLLRGCFAPGTELGERTA
ncbi:hypothetical protein AB4Z09_18300 [Rhodococcus sp. TAF43]|uniref:hypothetical protein n=1 Tax=Rhodococcus sp. TAF43 TaxID=3237483 RepID=UPI003F9DAA9F